MDSDGEEPNYCKFEAGSTLDDCVNSCRHTPGCIAMSYETTQQTGFRCVLLMPDASNCDAVTGKGSLDGKTASFMWNPAAQVESCADLQLIPGVGYTNGQPNWYETYCVAGPA